MTTQHRRTRDHRTRDHRTRIQQAAAAGILAVSALGLAGCGDTTGEETGTSVEEVQETAQEDPASTDAPYEGPYDAAFADQVDDFADRPVTLSAEVSRVLTETTFLIGGDEVGVEPLLVLLPAGAPDLQEGTAVQVTGTIHDSFDVPRLESDLGIDLQDDFLDEWEDKPFVMATAVETTA